MNIPNKLEEVIASLNMEADEELLIRRAAKEVLKKIEREMSVGYPKEIYEAAGHLLGRGKLLRGILIVLINGAYGFPKKEKALRLATAVELLHTASLIHDDIVDRAEIRRGVETVHKKFGLNIAIISTDLLFSIAYDLCSDINKKVAKIINKATRKMSEAEVLECILKNPSLDDYFQIIHGKSSVLIEAACESSAIISKAKKDEILSFQRYGELIGKVLQIRDDMLDYVSNEAKTGKSSPLIYGLKRANMIDILKKEKNLSLEDAIVEANELGKEFADKASKEVTFLEQKERSIFKKFVRLVLERKF